MAVMIVCLMPVRWPTWATVRPAWRRASARASPMLILHLPAVSPRARPNRGAPEGHAPIINRCRAGPPPTAAAADDSHQPRPGNGLVTCRLLDGHRAPSVVAPVDVFWRITGDSVPLDVGPPQNI